MLLAFAPAAWAATGLATGPATGPTTGPASLVLLWVAFGVAFMGGRAMVLLLRERSDGWLRVGA